MIRGIIGQSLGFRFLVVVIAGVILFVGIAQLGNMPVDVLPEYAPPYVEIQTEALGLSATEVEMLISLNLEELLMGVPYVQTIRSTSVPGLSSVVLVFKPGTDIYRARQLVQERITLAHMLPNVSKAPVILQPLSATSRVMLVGLSSDELSLIDMSVLARWNVRPALMAVPGVANVSIWGQRRRQLQVQVDPEWLRTQDVSLDQIVRTAGDALWVSPLSFIKASTPGTGGWIDTPQQRLTVRHVLPISEPPELAQVAVEDVAALRLEDVAEVVENHQPLIGDALLHDGTGLLLVVEKFPGSNTLEVTQGVEETLIALQPGLTGIEIDTTIFRPASFIETAIDNLTTSLIIGAVLIVLVIAAFFWEWRSTLISLVAITLSLVAAALVLYLSGTTMNVMVLAGLVIALAAVIDDAIIDVENIMRRLREHRMTMSVEVDRCQGTTKAGTQCRRRPMQGGSYCSQHRTEEIDESEKSTTAIILDAAVEMRSAILFATLIMVMAVVPLFFMEGLSGAFFRPLASSYVLAILTSLVVALMVTPALSTVLLSNAPLERRESPFVRWLRRGYIPVLSRTVEKPRLAYATIAVLVVIGIAVLPLLNLSLLPEFKERDLMIRWEGMPGTSHPEMVRLATQAGYEIQTITGVRNFAAHIGRAVMGDEVVGINSADLWVSLDPSADYDATVAALQETIDGYPGLVHEVEGYVQERVSQVLTGSSKAIVVRIYGREFDDLRIVAEDVRQALSGIEGVVDLATELQVEEPYIEIEVDLDKADHYGLKPGDVRRAAAIILAGIEVGSLFEEQKVFDVVVWGTPNTRQSLTDVRELLIETPGGDYVRLEDVADVRLAATLNTINREAISRRIDVGLNVDGRSLGAVARDIESALQEVEFPLEYHAEILGEYVDRQAAQQRLLIVAVAAVIGIFLLLQAAFESWRLAFLAILTLPMALVGGVLAAVLSGATLSLGALIGFLAILGIAARNGLMLYSRYQRLEEECGTFGLDLILRGSQERVAPIVVSALATALAMMPFVLFGDNIGNELLHPMAVIIIGGLITSTWLNLFVMPAMYLRFGRSPEPQTSS
ncbi:MAG: AcrB/AcrD/AcrF family protein [Anaerolineales bacterium]|nr:AcrB/AcrD/AcrF family protein [Anaerolineales bacterium]